MNILHKLLVDDDGTTAVEYAVMLAMILLSVIAAVQSVGGANGGMWGNVSNQLQNTPFGS